jgi:hypothetical protein
MPSIRITAWNTKSKVELSIVEKCMIPLIAEFISSHYSKMASRERNLTDHNDKSEECKELTFSVINIRSGAGVGGN